MSRNEENSSYLVFAGSYTNFDILAHLPHNEKVGNGVYCLNFENGNIELLSQVPCTNPAVMHFDARDSNTLYVLTEGIKKNGTIHTVRFDTQFNDSASSDDGKKNIKIQTSFESSEDIDTKGKSLCYLGLNNTHGIAINYWEGSIDVFELISYFDNYNNSAFGINVKKGILQHIEHNSIATQIEKMQDRRQVIHREDHWVNRQCGSHSHSAHFWKNWVFIPDLGDNSIYQYRYYEHGKNGDSTTILDYECQIPLKEGCGPRHMRFHPSLNICYVSNELNSTVTVLSLDDSGLDENSIRPRMKPIQYMSTVCPNSHDTQSSQKDSKNYVAEILVSSNGQDIYVSNRGHDTIAHFRLSKDGTIVENKTENDKTNFIPTHGHCPRHFAMSPDDRYLLVANQDTNSIAVFERDLDSGILSFKTQFVDDEFGAPNFLLFYPISNELVSNYNQSDKPTNNNANRDNCNEECILL